MPIEDTPEFRIGAEGERIISRLFRKTGWYVNPTANYRGNDPEGRAPLYLGAERNIILPDLDIVKNGVREWVEVKRFARPDRKILASGEHGFDEYLYRAYKKIELESGCPVRIVVIEYEAGNVVWQYLEELDYFRRFYRGPNFKGGSGRHMVFFPRDAFIVNEAILPAFRRPASREFYPPVGRRAKAPQIGFVWPRKR